LKPILSALAASLLVVGCGLGPPGMREIPLEPRQGGVELAETPFFPQETHQCGPAALAMVLADAGAEVTPEGLSGQVYVPGRKGSLQVELIGAIRREGFVPYPVVGGIPGLVEELRVGRPILVLLDLGAPVLPVWHYAVVIGYDPDSRLVVLRSGPYRRKVMSERRFLAAWTASGRWALVVLPPTELPARPERGRYLQAVADLEAVGKLTAAERAYRTALGAWPRDPTALLGLGNSLYGQGNLEGAERGYRDLLAAHPGSLAGFNNLAEVLAAQGKRREALATISQGLSRAPRGHPLRGTLEATQAEIQQDEGSGARRL
jgi:hypothetical protein